MAKLNEFCTTCKYKLTDKNIDEPCKRCAGVHIYSNYLFYESEGCDFCINEKEINQDESEYVFSIEYYKGNKNRLYAWDTYLDSGSSISINYCPMCGRKLT